MQRQKATLRLYLGMVGARSFLFWTAFVTGSIYYIRGVGMNPLQLVLVGTVLELTTFLCEIPTGVIADVYSRKLSVVLGFACIGVGFALQGAFPRFWVIVAAQLLYGCGWTFISGAEDAWLADEIGLEHLPDAYVRATQVSQAASFVGVFSSVALASVALNLPFLVSGCCLLALAGMLLLALPETGFNPASERTTWRKMTTTLTRGLHEIRGNRLLLGMLLITLVFGVSREGIDRLWEAHLLDSVQLPMIGSLDTVVWFGVINALAMLSTLALSVILRKRIRNLGDDGAIRWLGARFLLIGLAISAFALARSFAALAIAYVAIYTFREVGAAIQSAVVNRNTASQSRATVLSTISQMDAVGQAGGGPVLGAIAQGYGLRVSMLFAAAILSPIFALLGRIRRGTSVR